MDLKSKLLPAIVLAIGLLCHAAGCACNEADQKEIAHNVGIAFDAVATIIVAVRSAIAFVRRKKAERSNGLPLPPSSLILAVALSTVFTLSAGPLLVGCASPRGGYGSPDATPADRVRQAHALYNAIDIAVISAGLAGVIPPDMRDEINAVADAAKAALDKVDEANASGTDFDLSAALQLFADALREYQRVKDKIPAAPPATQPSANVQEPHGSPTYTMSDARHARRLPAQYPRLSAAA